MALPQPGSRPSFVWLQPGSGLFFLRRVDVVICLSTTSPGSQGTQGVPEVPQAAAGGGAGDGNAWEHSLWSQEPQGRV